MSLGSLCSKKNPEISKSVKGADKNSRILHYNMLKSDCHLPKKLLLFASMKAL